MSENENLIHKTKKKMEYVVLVHGILKDASSMRHIERHLKQQRYKVINIHYNYKCSIFDIADYLFICIDKILKKDNYAYKKVHFIGHSLGGLVVRAILCQNSIKNLGNVVQIATPNYGSEIADFLKNMFFYKRYCGKAGQELVTQNKVLQKQLGKIHYPLGAIIGTKSNILSNRYIKEKNDGRVSVTSAKVKGLQDYIDIYETHNDLLSNPKAIYEIMHFIKHGSFITSMNGAKHKLHKDIIKSASKKKNLINDN